MNSDMVNYSRQQKLAGKMAGKAHSAQKWKKPYNERTQSLATLWSRKKNQRLRKAALLCRAQEKHAFPTSEWSTEEPSFFDGFVGSNADVDTLREGGEMGTPILPNLNLEKKGGEWKGSRRRRERMHAAWKEAREVYHENQMV
jgi:hypothetical protein